METDGRILRFLLNIHEYAVKQMLSFAFHLLKKVEFMHVRIQRILNNLTIAANKV